MLRTKLLPTFNAVATGQTATVDLPLGIQYHAIWLEVGDNGGTTIASGNLLGDIRVKINGKVQRTHSAVELNALNGVNGTAYLLKTSGTAGQAAYRSYLPIYFAEPWRKDVKDQQMPAWNVAGDGISSFQIEVDIKAGLTTPVISGFYEWAPATGSLGAIGKVIRQTVGALGTVQDFNQLDRRDFLQGIHLFPTVEGTPKYVNKVKLTYNGAEQQDLITTLENQAKLLGRAMNPDTSGTPRYDLVIDYDDPINGALPLNGLAEFTLHVEYNAAAAGNLVMLIERAGPPE